MGAALYHSAALFAAATAAAPCGGRFQTAAAGRIPLLG